MNKKATRKKNQQKPPAAKPPKPLSPANQPPVTPFPPAADKPTEPADVNKCDDCAYEFGACDGVPKFADGTDRVIECSGFRNVQDMPTEDQKKEPPAPAEEPAAEPVHVVEKPGATEPEKKADEKTMKADLEKRKKLQRFQREEDLGKCPACDRPLKRTAFNSGRDAVRCTNPRCRQYRAVVRNIPAK
jgi:hypothetical protein